MPRIVRFHETGAPEVMKIEEMPSREPKAGEIRIRVHAIGLNRAEAMFRAGQYLETPSLPSMLGYEAAGVVDAVGPGVTGFAPGQAVSTVPAFSMTQYGMYGDEVIAPVHAVVAHPASVGFPQAAASWMQYLTAWGALVGIAGLRSGDTVLVPAATSSVGLAAIQICKAAGARPIALTSYSPANRISPLKWSVSPAATARASRSIPSAARQSRNLQPPCRMAAFCSSTAPSAWSRRRSRFSLPSARALPCVATRCSNSPRTRRNWRKVNATCWSDWRLAR
jgi:Zn-dependent alcohol dehydrogenase